MLNDNARAGWTLKTTVKDETRGMLPGSRREAVFLISTAKDAIWKFRVESSAPE